MVMEPCLPEEGVWKYQSQSHILKRSKAMAGRAGYSWGSRRALNTPCWTPCHMLFLLLTGYAVFYSWVPAREGLPRHLKIGLEMGKLGAREPETFQQVSALWTRTSLTEWLGLVHSGHPLWATGGSAAAPSAHLSLRRLKRDWVVLSTSCPENDKDRYRKVRAGRAEWVLQSHRVPVQRGLLLTGSFLAGSLSVLSSHQISQGQGSQGTHNIICPGANNRPYLLWEGRQGGWCDTSLEHRRTLLGSVSSTIWDPGGHLHLESREGILNRQFQRVQCGFRGVWARGALTPL